MKSKVLIINGPNLNLLGKREVEVYGSQSFESYFQSLVKDFSELELQYYQSNIEGELIQFLHDNSHYLQGVIINAGGYTHTSVALADALKAVHLPYVEVHISNITARESFRHTSLLSPAAVGCIFGFGLESYRLALEYFNKISKKY